MGRRFSTQQWQEDLRFLVSSMESIHPNLFHDISQDAFQYADPEHLRLPNSQLRLMVSKLFWQNDLAQDTRPWIEPHIPAGFHSADYFGLKDPAMEKVMDLIRHG